MENGRETHQNDTSRFFSERVWNDGLHEGERKILVELLVVRVPNSHCELIARVKVCEPQSLVLKNCVEVSIGGSGMAFGK